ncbi:MAG: hypothetical protein NTY33_02480 [Candidatus Moranbacteria bacterium]|nr:hypothetical protein [Candidatus Moranbacteria bacterium]
MQKTLKKINLNKAAIFSFFVFLFLFTFNKANAAGLVPCGLGASDPCTLCHFIVGIKGLIDWGMSIIIAVSIAGISIAGVLYVLSSGSSTLTTQAKGFITSVVIGFSLFLGAWLIINTTFYLLSAKKDDTSGTYNLGLTSKSWNSFSCSTTSSTMGVLPPTTDATIADYNCDKLTFQTSAVKNQCNDASSALQTMIVCMRNKLGTKMTINSISDNNGGGTKCYQTYPKGPQCVNDADTNCCHHAVSSCHYGGVNVGNSEAVDISTTTGLTVDNIITAANACNAGYTKDESVNYNHVHVSTTNCRKD